jgi:outer membrane lipase/esterase
MGAADPAASAANLGRAIDSVMSAGGETILILNLPDLGSTPAFRDGPAGELAAAWTLGFNAALASEVATRRGPDVTIFEADIFATARDFQVNPSAYGLVNLVDPVFPDNTLDPATTAYWDDVHPTETVHGIFAHEAALTLGIPEPSSLLLVLAAPVLLLRRQRSLQ